MLRLKELLFSDLERQILLEGNTNRSSASWIGIFRRLLHHRFLPVVLFRLSRQTMLKRIPVLPQIFTYLNLVLFGIEISPKCEIGPGVFFAHTSGIVIGATRIGRNVTLFQGVTLGAKMIDMSFDPQFRPTVGDNVILGSGCKILGGIYIGDNVTVGANSVVLESIEPNATVVGIPARRIPS